VSDEQMVTTKAVGVGVPATGPDDIDLGRRGRGGASRLSAPLSRCHTMRLAVRRACRSGVFADRRPASIKSSVTVHCASINVQSALSGKQGNAEPGSNFRHGRTLLV